MPRYGFRAFAVTGREGDLALHRSSDAPREEMHAAIRGLPWSARGGNGILSSSQNLTNCFFGITPCHVAFQKLFKSPLEHRRWEFWVAREVLPLDLID